MLISVYGHADRAIQINVSYVPKPPSKPLRINYVEEVILDPNSNIITEKETSRPWNDATNWPLYIKANEAYMFLQERYLRDKQSLWSYLITHIDSDVDHLIKLHPDYLQLKIWIRMFCGIYLDNQ